jgi:ribonuclease P protein subunit POP4
MRRSGEAGDAAKGELIGLRVRVTATNDPTLMGVEGLVVDETRHTFRLERSDGREVVVPKPGQTFRFEGTRGTFELPGSAISYSPEDRTKKAR